MRIRSRRFITSTSTFSLLALFLSTALSVRAQDPIETIRIDSDLVNLKVSVLGAKTSTTTPLLEQKDFVVMEDGKPQEIAFFAAADAPFDLVLLLDLSGSNKKKLKMIKSSAKRFVETARPIDRIAVVTFTDRPALYSTFTLDRKKLKRSIDDIDEAVGGTSFWDSLNYVLQNLIVQGPESQRSAIVLMTDGIDNALTEVPGPGSRIGFDTLLQSIRQSETIVFPIYLDTEEEVVHDFKRLYVSRVDYSIARQQLGQIASECATTMYRASKLSDLDELYGQVIRDLSRVYSIGYRPSNTAADGKWRNVEVQIAERPDLLARTRKGYYAKQASSQNGGDVK